MNKDFRKQRTENYFIDAACEIIRNDGMQCVTIRNVAEKAGYNSATIYSYFKNFSHLLLRAHIKFESELLQRINKDIIVNESIERYQVWPRIYVIMADYYLSNPNIFECIFVWKYEGGIPEELRMARAKQSAFAQYIEKNLRKISVETEVPLNYIYEINDACLSMTIGAVLLFIKQRFAQPRETLIKNLEKQISYVISCNLKSGRSEK